MNKQCKKCLEEARAFMRGNKGLTYDEKAEDLSYKFWHNFNYNNSSSILLQYPV